MMKVGDVHVWNAKAEPTNPLCVGADGWSLTIWFNDEGEVQGVLRHEYTDERISKVEGAGVIPAEYVADELEMYNQ